MSNCANAIHFFNLKLNKYSYTSKQVTNCSANDLNDSGVFAGAGFFSYVTGVISLLCNKIYDHFINQ